MRKKLFLVVLVLQVFVVFSVCSAAEKAQPKTYAGRGAWIGAATGGTAGLALGIITVNVVDSVAFGFGNGNSVSTREKVAFTALTTGIGAAGGAGVGALIGLAFKRKPQDVSFQPYYLPTNEGKVVGFNIAKRF